MGWKAIFEVVCSVPRKVLAERLLLLRRLLFSSLINVEAGDAIDSLTKLGDFISELCDHKTEGVFRLPPIIIAKVERSPGHYKVL